MRTVLFMLTLSLCLGLSVQGQLKRQGAFGIYPAPLTDSLSQHLNMDQAKGVYIAQVMPGGTSDKAGIQTGDVMIEVNGISFSGIPDLMRVRRDLREGGPFKAVVWRAGKRKKLQGAVIPIPYETSEYGEVIYDEVPFQQGLLRTIINRPKTAGKRPVIFFIPGYPCASYDGMPPHHPYRKLIDGFVKKGYVVMRTEKPGMGDGTGFDCVHIDIHTENQAFMAGYESLKRYDFVDTDQVFVLGHSLGGLTAPILAKEKKPKGVIVYGTVCEPWGEYLMRMLRFQNPRLGINFLQSEADMRLYHKLLYQRYVHHQSPKELAAMNPEFGRLLKRDLQWDGGDMIFGRHHSFWLSVHQLNLVQAWAETPSHVLSVFGEADFEALDPRSQKTISRHRQCP